MEPLHLAPYVRRGCFILGGFLVSLSAIGVGMMAKAIIQQFASIGSLIVAPILFLAMSSMVGMIGITILRQGLMRNVTLVQKDGAYYLLGTDGTETASTRTRKFWWSPLLGSKLWLFETPEKAIWVDCRLYAPADRARR